MRKERFGVVALVVLLDLVGLVISLPMEDHRDVGGKLSALSLADKGTSSHPPPSSVHHHPSNAASPMEVDPANPPSAPASTPVKFREIRLDSDGSRRKREPDFFSNRSRRSRRRPETHFFSNRKHRPDKVEQWQKDLDAEYYKHGMEKKWYHLQKSEAKVASEGIKHLSNGYPVRVALHDGVRVYHGPGKLRAAKAAHRNDRIHQIERTGNVNDPYLMTSPRNKSKGPLTPEQQAALKNELDAKVINAQKARQASSSIPKQWYNPQTGRAEEKRPPTVSLHHEGARTYTREQGQANRFKPY